MKRDIYEQVTTRIIAALESGTIPWLKPWKDSANGSIMGRGFEPYNAVSGRLYNGINSLILGCDVRFNARAWLTFKQAKELGGHVRKGEHGTLIVFWKFERKPDRNDPTKLVTVPFARGYTVFNVEQCEGLDTGKLKGPKLPPPPKAGEYDINAIAADRGAIVRHGGNRAFYAPSLDVIQMPSADAFKSSEHYRSTLAHELTHWTGHASRCNRDFSGRFGDSAYAFEELVAEIGSAFLCTRLGIAMEGLQHADYVANWLKVLKDDKRAIFTAASKARQACEFIMGTEEGEESAESDESAESRESSDASPTTLANAA